MAVLFDNVQRADRSQEGILCIHFHQYKHANRLHGEVENVRADKFSRIDNCKYSIQTRSSLEFWSKETWSSIRQMLHFHLNNQYQKQSH